MSRCLHIIESSAALIHITHASTLRPAPPDPTLSPNQTHVHLRTLLLPPPPPRYAYGGLLASQGLLPVRVLLSSIGFTFSLVFSAQGVVNTLGDIRRATVALARVRALLGEAEAEKGAAAGAAAAAGNKDQKQKGSSGAEGGSDGESLTSSISSAAASAAASSEGGTSRPLPTAHGFLSARQAAQHGDFALENVSFRYPSRPDCLVLDKVSLRLQRGTVTALVGRSGAGKSSLAALLARFYEPTEGRVTLGGRPAEDFSLEDWSRSVALVSQDPVLFSGTVAENIAYGRGAEGAATCSREEIIQAAQEANAHEFIMRLPQGYDTPLGARGAGVLSGGQRQRLSIARALIKDAPFLCLDEVRFHFFFLLL
jgi:ATP-binding cassette, subfamily B (MDR/TAP), member 10